MSEQRVTMKDVAKAAGVTTAAVSYAISGKRPISDETRKRVEAAIKELGYTPNMAARTLSSAGRSSKLIGVVVPQTEGGGRLMFQNQFYCRDTRQHRAVRAPGGLSRPHFRHGRERRATSPSPPRGTSTASSSSACTRRILPADESAASIPIVLIDSYCNDHYYHNVRIDDAYGSYLATKYVLERGHRDIAFFCGRIKDNGVMKKRLAGYRDALGEYSVEFSDALVFEGDIDYKDGIESANRLMDTQVTRHRRGRRGGHPRHRRGQGVLRARRARPRRHLAHGLRRP